MSNLEKPKKIIYIVGAGRSGSTVLDKYLGAHSNSFSLGEIGLFQTSLSKQIVCSCQKQMTECDLYGDIIEKLNANNKDFITEFNLKEKNLFNSISQGFRMLFSILLGINLLSRKSKKILKNNADLFLEIDKKIDGELYIDSTKNIVRALFLNRFYLNFLKSSFVFLIRDPRSIVYSRRKKEVVVKLKEGSRKIITNTHQDIYKALNSWNFYNSLTYILLFLFVSKNNKEKITYKDFIGDPKAFFRNLEYFHQLKHENLMSNLNSKVHHIIGGNYSKINASSIVNKNIDYEGNLSSDDIKIIKRKTKRVRSLIGLKY